MKYQVTIEEFTDDQNPVLNEGIERYRQTVDVLDLKAVMAAVNKTPRKPRTPKVKAEK